MNAVREANSGTRASVRCAALTAVLPLLASVACSQVVTPLDGYAPSDSGQQESDTLGPGWVRRRSSVDLLQFPVAPSPGERLVSVRAFFFAPQSVAETGFETSAAGPCRVTSARSSLPTTESAGTLSVRSPSVTLVAERERTVGFYTRPVQDPVWSPGDEIEIRATGDLVPAFVARLTFPQPVEIMLPAAGNGYDDRLTVPVSRGLETRWGETTAAEIEIFVEALWDGISWRRFQCYVPADQRSFVLDSSLLRPLIGASSVHLRISSVDRDELTLGERVIDVRAANVAYWRNLAIEDR